MKSVRYLVTGYLKEIAFFYGKNFIKEK